MRMCQNIHCVNLIFKKGDTFLMDCITLSFYVKEVEFCLLY